MNSRASVVAGDSIQLQTTVQPYRGASTSAPYTRAQPFWAIVFPSGFPQGFFVFVYFRFDRRVHRVSITFYKTSLFTIVFDLARMGFSTVIKIISGRRSFFIINVLALKYYRTIYFNEYLMSRNEKVECYQFRASFSNRRFR